MGEVLQNYLYDLGGFFLKVVVALVTRLDGSIHMWGSYAITFRSLSFVAFLPRFIHTAGKLYNS